MPPYTLGNTQAIWFTWFTWVTNVTASTTATTNPTWGLWCNQTASSSATLTVWDYSVDGTGMGGPVIVSQDGWRAPTVEEVAEREERLAAERVRQEQAQVEREAAREKARALLEDVLTEAQRTELSKDGHFHVATRDGERVYRLRPGQPPIRVKGEDGSQYSYCIHPSGAWPAEDVTAALKLMLETDEERFLRTANATRLAGAR